MTTTREAFDGSGSPLPFSRRHRQSRTVLQAARLLLFLAAACLLVWTLVVWRWHDPFTGLYTHQQQKALASAYARAESAWRGERELRPGPAGNRLAALARRYRVALERGDPVGRLTIPRLAVDLMVANGIDTSTLRKGPGRDLRSFVPGEGKLVYLAGHRTTYLAPFSHIDALRPGDRITFELPYGTFVYAVTRAIVVSASDLSVLRSPARETLALQTCHPRFFASERYVVFARLTSGPSRPRGGEG